MAKLVLLDGHAIIHRAFHAIRPLKTSTGEPVNALFGFISMLINIWEIEQPEFLAVAFDRKGATFRQQVNQAYKQNRAKTPTELIQQIKRIYEFLRILQVPIFSQKGLEADDLLATLVTQAQQALGLNMIIVSSDRDLLQLVSKRIAVHDLTGGYRKSVNFGPAQVQAKFGFAAKYLPDYKGLAGDASDNLSGVPGVGAKTAAQLIQQYGSLEEIYAHLGEVPASLQTKLGQHRALAFQTKRLTTLVRNVPVDFALDRFKFPNFEVAAVWDFFARLEFASLRRRFQKAWENSPPENFAQASLF